MTKAELECRIFWLRVGADRYRAMGDKESQAAAERRAWQLGLRLAFNVDVQP